MTMKESADVEAARTAAQDPRAGTAPSRPAGGVPGGAAVTLFHGLADPVRLAIVRLLSDGERRVVDLTRELGLAQSTVSGHLSCLRSAGLVDAHPHGRSTYYALARPELWSLLAAAEQLLEAAGTTAALCPAHHRPEPVVGCGAAVHGCLLHGSHPEAGREPHDRAVNGHPPGGTPADYGGGPRPAAPNRPGRH